MIQNIIEKKSKGKTLKTASYIRTGLAYYAHHQVEWGHRFSQMKSRAQRPLLWLLRHLLTCFLLTCHYSVILGKYHSSAPPTTEDNSLSNGGDEETTEQILKRDQSAAGIWCQLKNSHGTQAPVLALSKDVVGIVATLGKVDDENLSRFVRFVINR